MGDEESDGRSRRAATMREGRRQQVLDQSLRVFAERGYHDASIQDIVEAAGVARGTFYQYFDSKEAVFNELIAQLLARLEASVLGVDRQSPVATWPQQLHAIVVGVLRTLGENRAFCTVLLKQGAGQEPGTDKKVEEFYDSLQGFLQAALSYGQQTGFIRRDLDLTITAASLLGATKQVMLEFFVRGSGQDVDYDGVARGILDFALYGVVPRPS